MQCAYLLNLLLQKSMYHSRELNGERVEKVYSGGVGGNSQKAILLYLFRVPRLLFCTTNKIQRQKKVREKL